MHLPTLLSLTTTALAATIPQKRDYRDSDIPSAIPAPGDGKCAVVSFIGTQFVFAPGAAGGWTGDQSTAPKLGVIDGKKHWIYQPESLLRTMLDTTLKWDGHSLDWSAR